MKPKKIFLKILLLIFSLCCFATTFADAPQLKKTSIKPAEKPFAEQKQVKKFIRHMVNAFQFDEKQLTELFNQIKLNPVIIKKAKTSYKRFSWDDYRNNFIAKRRIQNGLQFWAQHEAILNKVAKQYQVSPAIIVTIIGMESNYGAYTGNYRVFDALANIAFNYPHRRDYFKYQLQEFLLWCRDNHLTVREILGSRDGGIGQSQFMPDNVRRYAINFNGKDDIDLINNTDDAIASTANFLQSFGWQLGGNFLVFLPTHHKYHWSKLPLSLIRLTLNKEIVPIYGLPERSIFTLKTASGTTRWIGLHNFFVLRYYNRYLYYALAASELAEILERHMEAKSKPARIFALENKD